MVMSSPSRYKALGSIDSMMWETGEQTTNLAMSAKVRTSLIKVLQKLKFFNLTLLPWVILKDPVCIKDGKAQEKKYSLA